MSPYYILKILIQDLSLFVHLLVIYLHPFKLSLVIRSQFTLILRATNLRRYLWFHFVWFHHDEAYVGYFLFLSFSGYHLTGQKWHSTTVCLLYTMVFQWIYEQSLARLRVKPLMHRILHLLVCTLCYVHQEKSNKRFIRICPSAGHTMPKPWGHDAQQVGRQCPSHGEHLWFQ